MLWAVPSIVLRRYFSADFEGGQLAYFFSKCINNWQIWSRVEQKSLGNTLFLLIYFTNINWHAECNYTVSKRVKLSPSRSWVGSLQQSNLERDNLEEN